MKGLYLLFLVILILNDLPLKIKTASIQTGYYKIISALTPNMVLDDRGPDWEYGAKIQLWSSNNESGDQSFFVEKIDSEYYAIRNAHSGYSLDVPFEQDFDGQKIILWKYHGGINQQWKLLSSNNGCYFIETKLSGKCLDIEESIITDGTKILLFSNNRSNNQKWKFIQRDMYYTIYPTILKHFKEDCINFGIVIFYGNEILEKVTGWMNILFRLIFLYTQFNHSAKYDIKRPNNWNLFFDIIFPGRDVQFLFDGEMITPEDLGNLIYGYIGRLLGFSDRILYQGGGYAASGLTYLHSPENYYGDSKEDHYNIERGMKLAEKEGIKEGLIDFDLYDLATSSEKIQGINDDIIAKRKELFQNIKEFAF